MRPVRRMLYPTMHSWNNQYSIAYNLKIYEVIDHKLQNIAYDLLSNEEHYHDIAQLIHEFDSANNYEWQAGFNGRSSGYLVLYRGGIKDDTVFVNFSSIAPSEVPADVKRAFRKLAIDILKLTEQKCKERIKVCHAQKV